MSRTLPAGFRACELGDVLTLKRGYDLPHRVRRGGDVPIISSSGITGYHDTVKVDGPGVVTGRYGTLGEVFFSETPFWPLNTALYVRDFKGNDPRFVSYFLRTIGLGGQNVAGAVPGINRNVVHRLSVVVPDVERQKRIAGVLAAYDDLIANNARRVALLEEAVHRLYREWFVHLRFPGHERVEVVDGVPAGWSRVTLGAVVKFGSGKTPSKKNDQFWTGPVPWLSAKDMSGQRYWDTGLRVSHAAIQDGAPLANAGDLFILVRGMRLARELPVGRAMRPMSFNQDVKRLEMRGGLTATFLQAWFREHESDVLGQVDEAAHGTKRLQTPALAQLEVLVPGAKLMTEFSRIADEIFALAANTEQQVSQLTQARDGLLPRLMNGSLAV